LEYFRQAVESQTEAPHLGRTKKSLVWCAPREDLDVLKASGVEEQQLLDVLGMRPSKRRGMMEFFYPCPFKGSKGNLFKPHSVHAGMNSGFEPTIEEEDFGRTKGSGAIPGVREIIHDPLLVAEALQDGAGLRTWRE